jgi:glycosyltransferase involved in cell wall biosynthesis
MIVGGAQENTLFTIRGHLEHGYDTVLLTGPTLGPEGKLLEHEGLANLKVVEEPDLVRAISPLRDWRAYRGLLKHFRSCDYDVVHTHSSKAGVLARIAARKAGIPVVVHTVHGQAFHQYLPAWKNWIYITAERWAAKHCDRIYAVADAMIDQCVEAGVASRAKYQTVYSGMDLEPYLTSSPDAELRESLGIPESAPVVGKIARLFELKGYDYLVKAAPAIAEAVPEVRFLIVGDGELRQWLESEFERLNLRDRVVFTGLIPPQEIHRYTALMDVLVHLSLREGLPRTVTQALASAKPAVGFALDGTPEVILNDQTGILCPPRDVAAVSDGVIKLLNDPALAQRLGAAGREHVREKWDWRYMVDQLEAEYDRLLNTEKEGSAARRP